MTDQEIKKIISKNITWYRTRNGFTQSQLAEKINYSDKSISKWERGEGIPDTIVLYKLAEIFNISINDFFVDEKTIAADKTKYGRLKKILVPIMSVVIVWLVAVIGFVLADFIDPKNDTFVILTIFAYASLASFVVFSIYSKKWWNLITTFLSITGVVWTSAVSIHLSIVAFNLQIKNFYFVYSIAAIINILVVLIYMLKILKKNKDEIK